MKVEIAQIEKALTDFENAVKVNDENFIDVLECCMARNRNMTIADIIGEYTRNKAGRLSQDEMLQYIIDGEYDDRTQDYTKQFHKDVYNVFNKHLAYCRENFERMGNENKTGIQSIVGYIVFCKAYAMSNVDISQEQFDKLNKYIEDKGDDANLCIADIEKKVADICWTQRHIDGEYTEKQQTQKARKMR